MPYFHLTRQWVHIEDALPDFVIATTIQFTGGSIVTVLVEGAEQWSHENCQHWVVRRRGWWYFENPGDAALFRLRWGGEVVYQSDQS